MDHPKFLIVTLYSGEPGYDRCLSALKSQLGVEVKHVVISGYPEHAAHKMCYEWFNNEDPCMIRVKLDADVVLNEGMLSVIGGIMQARPDVDHIDPYVDDYLTDTPLKAGLTIYSSRVKFKEPPNHLWCDRNVTTEKHLTTMSAPLSIASHMKYCDERTAFRYGFHRGLKSQLQVYELVKTAHAKHNDRIRLMALRGFERAQSEEFHDWHHNAVFPTDKFNYDDQWFQDAYMTALMEP